MEYKILNINELSNTRAQEVDYENEVKSIKEIVAKIKRTMKKNNLISLSAPAIGYNKRIFCIDFSDKEIKTFINPMVLNTSGVELTREICSSIPGKEFIRPRHKMIDVIYQKYSGDIRQNQFTGMAATILEHEIDHLDGVTLQDIGLEIESDFDKASKKDQFAIIDMYLQSLKNINENLNNEIENDNVLKVVSENEKLATLMAQGKIDIEINQSVKEK